MNIDFSLLDSTIVFSYFLAMLLIGMWFYIFKKETSEEFAVADRSLTAWPLAFSILASDISSMGFFAIPGKSYADNWSFFVFCLSYPFAALIVIKYFIPFYRSTNDICAYSHLNRRFGRWASVYASICYVITRVAYIATILYLFSVIISALFGLNGKWVIFITGSAVIAYTCIGGLKAVIYSDVVQAILLLVGAVICSIMLLMKNPDSISSIISTASDNSKFNLGDFDFSWASPNFWVILISGFLAKISELSVHQGLVQRYYAAVTTRDAQKSLLIVAIIFIPFVALLLFIGTELFSFYQISGNSIPKEILGLGNDSTLPYFIFTESPIGIKGFLLITVLAAGMSSIDTAINGASTTIYSEIYKPFFKNNSHSMAVLYGTSIVIGVAAIGIAMLFSPEQSILDVWFAMASVFSGGMFGLFALGLISKKSTNSTAIISVATATLLVAWIGISSYFSNMPEHLKSPFHPFLARFIGTATVLFLGLFLTSLFNKKVKKVT